MKIRTLSEDDSLKEITSLLHRSYRRLAEMDLHFVATKQDVRQTAKRCAAGECLVADLDGKVVGTITVKPPGSEDGCAWYLRKDVAVFGQFAVDPDIQCQGLGTQLIQAAELIAVALGAKELALDTAEGATHLIDYYSRRGFRVVDSVDWKSTNYVSVVMSKTLG